MFLFSGVRFCELLIQQPDEEHAWQLAAPDSRVLTEECATGLNKRKIHFRGETHI